MTKASQRVRRQSSSSASGSPSRPGKASSNCRIGRPVALRRREEPGQGRAHGCLKAIARTEQAQRPVFAERLQAHLHSPQARLAAQRTQRLAQRQEA